MDYATKTFARRDRANYKKARRGLTPRQRQEFKKTHQTKKNALEVAEFIQMGHIKIKDCVVGDVGYEEFDSMMDIANTEYSKKVQAAYLNTSDNCAMLEQLIREGVAIADLLRTISTMNSHPTPLAAFVAVTVPRRQSAEICRESPLSASIESICAKNFRIMGEGSVGAGVSREAVVLMAREIARGCTYTHTSEWHFKIGAIVGQMVNHRVRENLNLDESLVKTLTDATVVDPPSYRLDLAQSIEGDAEFISDADIELNEETFEQYVFEYSNLYFLWAGFIHVAGVGVKVFRNAICEKPTPKFEYSDVTPEEVRQFFNTLSNEDKAAVCDYGGGGTVVINYAEGVTSLIARTCSKIINIPKCDLDMLPSIVAEIRAGVKFNMEE